MLQKYTFIHNISQFFSSTFFVPLHAFLEKIEKLTGKFSIRT